MTQAKSKGSKGQNKWKTIPCNHTKKFSTTNVEVIDFATWVSSLEEKKESILLRSHDHNFNSR